MKLNLAVVNYCARASSSTQQHLFRLAALYVLALFIDTISQYDFRNMSKIKLLLIEKNKIVSCIFILDCICFCNISNHLVSSCRIRFLTPHHRHSTITLITYACETHVCCIPPPSCSTSFHRNILPRPPVKTNNDPERQQSGVAGVIRFRCQLLMRWRTLGNPGPRIGYV